VKKKLEELSGSCLLSVTPVFYVKLWIILFSRCIASRCFPVWGKRRKAETKILVEELQGMLFL